jgi:hypothetical protein
MKLHGMNDSYHVEYYPLVRDRSGITASVGLVHGAEL